MGYSQLFVLILAAHCLHITHKETFFVATLLKSELRSDYLDSLFPYIPRIFGTLDLK